MTNNKNIRNSYWRIPEVEIGSFSFPRLYLGDHGFLQMYGSQFTIEEISKRMQFALGISSIGLAAGDERCLKTAYKCLQIAKRENSLLYHTDLHLTSGGQPVEFPRAMKHLFLRLTNTTPEKLKHDPVVGHFLSQYAKYTGYDENFIGKLDLDLEVSRYDENLIHQYRPRIVTVGGDYLDFAIAVGRIDLVNSGIEYYRNLCAKKGLLLFITLYLATDMIRDALISPDLFNGVMVPINLLGYGMLPSSDELLFQLRQLSKPILAMHVLASGKISPQGGLDYVFNDCGSTLAVVGASQYRHIEQLIRAGHETLGAG